MEINNPIPYLLGIIIINLMMINIQIESISSDLKYLKLK